MLWVADRDRLQEQTRRETFYAQQEQLMTEPNSTMVKLVFNDKSRVYFNLGEGKNEEYRGLIAQRGMLIEDITSKVKQLSALRKKGP